MVYVNGGELIVVAVISVTSGLAVGFAKRKSPRVSRILTVVKFTSFCSALLSVIVLILLAATGNLHSASEALFIVTQIFGALFLVFGVPYMLGCAIPSYTGSYNTNS